MDIKYFSEIIDLWKKTVGVGLRGNDDFKKFIKIVLEKNSNTCFIAIDKENIIGTIMAGNDERRGHIYYLMVKPELKNGTTKNLLEKAERKLKEGRDLNFFFVVYKNNKTGNNFSERNGYNKRKD